jgi:hyperosmotically inducible periplasmic protein
MRSKTILSILVGAMLSFTAAACSSADNTNTNTNTNANRAANANATATPTATATPAGSAYNRSYNSRDDYNKNENSYRAEAKNAGEAIGQGLEDGWIHLKVRAALATENNLKDWRINVDVDNNVVTLRGTVPTAADKTKAAEAARKVEGVKNVNNKLEVKPDDSSNKNGNGNANTKK